MTAPRHVPFGTSRPRHRACIRVVLIMSLHVTDLEVACLREDRSFSIRFHARTQRTVPFLIVQAKEQYL